MTKESPALCYNITRGGLQRVVIPSAIYKIGSGSDGRGSVSVFSTKEYGLNSYSFVNFDIHIVFFWKSRADFFKPRVYRSGAYRFWMIPLFYKRGISLSI